MRSFEEHTSLDDSGRVDDIVDHFSEVLKGDHVEPGHQHLSLFQRGVVRSFLEVLAGTLEETTEFR